MYIHKPVFYTTGFLFHLESQQILLHQPRVENDTTSSPWAMFGEENNKGEDPGTAFQRIVKAILGVKLPKESIFPVYNYYHDLHKRTHYVYYAQVKKMQKYQSKKATLSWFTFKQTIKLPFVGQTKQDIIIAQRVIEAKEREKLLPKVELAIK